MRRVVYEFGRALRETGQAMDRAGMRALDNNAFKEKFSRHRQVMNLGEKLPTIAYDAWVAPNATVVGDVEVGNDASVWYNCVVRGDQNDVKIGFRSNIQDGTVIRTSKETIPGVNTGTFIGNQVTVGHGCMLSSCTIEDDCLIGMGSVVLDGAVVEQKAVLAAGTVVPPGRRIPSGQLWAGNPAKFVRELSEDDVLETTKLSEQYKVLATTHSDEFLPYGQAYLDAEKIKAANGKM